MNKLEKNQLKKIEESKILIAFLSELCQERWSELYLVKRAVFYKELEEKRLEKLLKKEKGGVCSPFLKWAGGKSQSIKEIIPLFPTFERYFEPFIGGGIVLLTILPRNAIINNINKELINSWRIVREYPKELIRELEEHKLNHSEEYFYRIREMFNKLKEKENEEPTQITRAGMFIYLNKGGYNGLYRENAKGGYNAPFGHKKEISLFEETNIMSVSEYLKQNNIRIFTRDYKEIEPLLKAGDFFYLDPPYDGTYNGYNFQPFSQEELKEFCDLLSKKGVKWLQTNKDTERIRELYQGYKLKNITSNSVINSDGKARKNVRKDLIITNYAY